MIKVHPTRPVLRTVEQPFLAKKLMAGKAPVKWIESDLSLTPVLQDIALRHGQVVEDGVLLDYDVLYAYLKIDGVREAKDFLDNSPVSHEGTADVTAATVEKIQSELDEVLAAPIKPEVAEHWKNLGGR